MKENIKKAMDLAEQEVQEKEITKLKGIIKDLLQKKVDKEEEKREIEKEISVIKQTIDDFKAGRLDKIKELIESDSKAEKMLPFRVVIVNQPVITRPWDWTYQLQPIHPTITMTSASATGSGATYITSGTAFTGNVSSHFTSGTYKLLNGKVINL